MATYLNEFFATLEACRSRSSGSTMRLAVRILVRHIYNYHFIHWSFRWHAPYTNES